MAIHQATCNVLPGTAEYFKKSDVVSGDCIELCFEDELTASNIVFEKSGTVSGVSIELIYPASKSTLVVKDSISTNFYLNEYGNQSNLWYRLPAGSRIRADITTVTGSCSATLCVIGKN